MFTTPRPNVIESDEGFSVEIIDKTNLSYSIGKETVSIECELLAGPSGLAVYSDSVNEWMSPRGERQIGIVERDEIIANIRRAFQYRGFEIQVL